MARNAAPVKIVKESLFMRVVVDDEPTFLDVTSHVGKDSPYKSKVRTTVGSRVSDKVVSFSILQVTKATSKRVLDSELRIPRTTLASSEEVAARLSDDETFGSADVIVQMDDREYRFRYAIDDAGVMSLEPAFEDEPFELPTRPLRFTLYFRSPKAERVLAISFSGFIDRKPGDSETVTRMALKAVANLSGLAHFRILSGVETVDLPSPPSGPPAAPARKADDHVRFDIALNLFDESGAEHMGSGTVEVEIDLDHANAATGRLLYHVAAPEELEAVLGVYKTTLMDAIATAMKELIPEAEQADLTYDIVLGQVTSGTIGRLKEATSVFPHLDLTPSQYRARPRA